MSKINVLHTRVIANQGGGPDKTIMRCNRYIDRNRFNMFAAYIHPKNDNHYLTYKSVAQKEGIKFFDIPESSSFNLFTVYKLLSICKRNKISIWHSHDYKTDIIGVVISFFYPIKLITTIHGFTCENFKTKIYAYLNKKAYRFFDKIICVNKYLKASVLKDNIKSDKIHYISNAIDINDYKLNNLSNKYFHKTINIGIVSRLSKEKGLQRALRLFHLLLKNNPNLRLHIVGDGPEKNNLLALANELKINQSITWHGWQTNTSNYIKFCDVSLTTSFREGLPNSVLESMLHKVPVISTNVGGIPDLITDSKNGILLNNSDNVATWADKVAPVLSNTNHLKIFGLNARDCVINHYSFVHRTKLIESVYYDAIYKAA